MLARRQRSFWRNQQGSALIEGAAVIPLLMALVFGVLDLGLHDAASYLADHRI